ncbi:hypothetical protein BU16DRAFT_537320 [Lophium mytilinum]|uniref:Uncharacterized protein n=1 Tax=Lophium mytilinum TaxID=390894 RepID=A0A6A6R2R4_9PEZI|nr:hypothetical protein BU16DRAFT_537320 [Lophium mytilinum]
MPCALGGPGVGGFKCRSNSQQARQLMGPSTATCCDDCLERMDDIPDRVRECLSNPEFGNVAIGTAERVKRLNAAVLEDVREEARLKGQGNYPCFWDKTAIDQDEDVKEILKTVSYYHEPNSGGLGRQEIQYGECADCKSRAAVAGNTFEWYRSDFLARKANGTSLANMKRPDYQG